jgi:hypothetical protein
MQAGGERMQAYLFVHFREKTTPDGEQVYLGISTDGFRWEMVNGGHPVLWSFLGEKGVRDCTIIRCEADNKYRILATDLSLAYNFRRKYNTHWPTVARNGSKCLSMWESEDLVNWSEQTLLELGDENFGCLWAPDVFRDAGSGDYIIHWSSSHSSNNFGDMGIWFTRTRDFRQFTPPRLLYRKVDAGVIDSAVYEENGKYYMFLKSDRNPERIILVCSEHPEGPYERVPEFDRSMEAIEAGLYEGPTAVRLEDGRWCLFLDYYGVPGAGQGYVPFTADSLGSGEFVRSDEQFSFPYGYKHGTVIPITMEEYERIRNHDWSDKGWQ